MEIRPTHILVMHRDEQLRDHLRGLAGQEFTFRAVCDWAELEEAAREAPPYAVAVVDPLAGGGVDPGAPSLRNVIAQFPSLTVFAAVGPECVSAMDCGALDGIGLAGMITVGPEGTTGAMAERFREVRSQALRLLLSRVVPQAMPGRADAILATAVEIVSSGGTGRDVAGALSTSRRTLLKWLERSELPPTRRLLVWLRVLEAADLLDDPGRSVASVARACGYSSDASLRRAMIRRLGKSPTELRSLGAFAEAARAFLGALDRCSRWRRASGTSRR